jgi:hypothetical protein
MHDYGARADDERERKAGVSNPVNVSLADITCSSTAVIRATHRCPVLHRESSGELSRIGKRDFRTPTCERV